jgi:hypothetical protein
MIAGFLVWRGSLEGPDNYANDDFAESDFPAGTNAVAMLTRAAGVVWEDPESASETGSTLWPGWMRLRSGVVQIEFFSGARVIVEGPAEIRLVSQMEALLRSGRLSADVPTQARGFKVRTAGVTVVDLGTEFGVARLPASQPEVHVFSGKVELSTPQRDQRPHELTAGQAMSVGARNARSMTADRAAFMTPQGLAEREAAEQRARYEAWKQNARALSQDPATLIHFTFEEQDLQNRTLANHGAGARPDSQGSIVGCDWVQGRWPGKGALEFRRPGDRVRMLVPEQTQSLTYMMWVRVDSLPHARNALVLPQKFREHEVHWQINNAGGVWFSVRRGDPMDESRWDRLVTTPVITAHQFSRWIHLAAVYDGPGRRMSIYLNGEEVQPSKTIREPVDLKFDVLELGNWDPAPEEERMQRWLRGQTPDFLNRNFHGRIDEFAMLSRAMTPEEIRNQYESGKPRGSMLIAETEDGPRAAAVR